jgi:RNA polymerase sigma-70 factor (ECF subfamily)
MEVTGMTDLQIIELYWAREEAAIRETDLHYGKKLHSLADRIVQNFEDAQECVSDTYLKTWDTIPPKRPEYFFAYIAKICRNFALGVLDWKSAAKRKGEVVSLTQEMQACIPDPAHERRLEGEELGKLLNRFLESLSCENRVIFLRRYWYMDTIGEIAQRYGMTQSKVKTQLHRTRAKLHGFLEKEGVSV